MRALSGILVAVLWSVASPAFAGDLFTTDGMPVCDSPEHLREFLMAGLQRDERWIHELAENCPTVNGGLKAVIIEDLPSDTDAMHVVKIRVFSPRGKGSATGYAVNIGLRDKPAK